MPNPMPFTENSSLLFSSTRLQLVISKNSQFFACYFYSGLLLEIFIDHKSTYKLHLFLGEFVYSLCEAMAKAAESAVAAAAASEACIGGGG